MSTFALQMVGSMDQLVTGHDCRNVEFDFRALGDSGDRYRGARRLVIAELFEAWWERHHDGPIAIRDLDDDVKHLLDPQGRSRQYLSSQLEKLDGTR